MIEKAAAYRRLRPRPDCYNALVDWYARIYQTFSDDFVKGRVEMGDREAFFRLCDSSESEAQLFLAKYLAP